MLEDILPVENIKLGVEVNNWEEAIRAGGSILKAHGYIRDEYIDSMINVVKEIGPYIVIAPGIAMPHGRPEAGVLKIGLSLITLKSPIKFGSRENDPVKIVICLCAIDHITHLKALSELVQFLADDEFVSTVLNSKDPGEVINYILENPVSKD
jgi:mannitol/fructose-specific phosphotransferase system IIA component (Ntr-type)